MRLAKLVTIANAFQFCGNDQTAEKVTSVFMVSIFCYGEMIALPQRKKNHYKPTKQATGVTARHSLLHSKSEDGSRV